MPNYQQRMQRFQDLIAGAADLVFFHIGTDLDYLTGIHRDIPNYGRVLHPGAWLEGAWLSAERAPILTLPRMTAELGGKGGISGFEIRVLGDWDDPAVMAKGIIDEMKLPASPRIAVSENAEAESLIQIQKLIPDARFVSATALLRKLRVIKDADEIETMRAAGRITEAALTDAVATFKLGMTELDVVAELDYQMKRHGSLGPSFTTSLYNTGTNHPMLLGQPLKTWPRKLNPPVSVLLDFGAVLDGMCYDYGRTVSFGTPSAEQIKVHRLIMDAQAAGIAALKAGEATCAEVDSAARDVIAAAGYDKAFRHRLGHAIGSDVHEPPFLTKGSDTVVQEGMIFTVEPSILQDGSFSARVEDCIVVRPGGGEPLTRGFQDLIVID
ncbi:Xaa-Pro dipeptidase [Kaistia soli DSM 19436]|uniref:Xaa-Pro dipeptidase n=1 Tax=Kaistia soli DSM 19436 TaxID=1122133 RepID=A0A1M5J1E0_9HYPH|nr:Xaa-Pro peptidase family protein [Kaistia soli]SHG34404.1 Xaa-Pro dipeptidase [Kaistia soli DSM 19436]